MTSTATNIWDKPIYRETNELVCEFVNHTPKHELVRLSDNMGLEWDGPEPLMDELREQILNLLGKEMPA